jgi:hypothetical protein
VLGVESVSRLVDSFRFEDDDDDDEPALALLWFVDVSVAKAPLAYGKPLAVAVESMSGNDGTPFLRSSGGVNASTSSSK